MALYQHTQDDDTIVRADGATIPADPANRDYADYLAWVAAGNTADPYVPPVVPPATLLNPGDFLARFTPAEQAAVQQACISNAQIALGLTMGLARGLIDLNGPLLAPWLNALVSTGCITAARKIVIMTP